MGPELAMLSTPAPVCRNAKPSPAKRCPSSDAPPVPAPLEHSLGTFTAAGPDESLIPAEFLPFREKAPLEDPLSGPQEQARVA